MLGTFFEPNFFVGNRNRLRTEFAGTAPIVVPANGLLQRNGDSSYAFRQDSNFWYLTGIDEPDVVLVIDRDNEYLIVPVRGTERAAFDGQPDLLRMAERAGIETIYDEPSGWKQLGKRLTRVKYVASVMAAPNFDEKHGLYSNPARARLLERLSGYNQTAEMIDLRPVLAKLRAIKQPEELRAIRRAIQLTARALNKVHNNIASYDNEHQVEAVLLGYIRKHGSTMAYQTIVAADANACVLHYVANNAPLGERLLIDVGAEVENYAADITRTFSLSSPSKRVKDVHEVVMAIQKFAMNLLKPGILLKDYELKVSQLMGEKLRELGLIKVINADNVRQYYPHSTSHFLGLDVHDAADYSQPLAPGNVLTVEPGIYIPKEGIGVRIEDDVLITPTGCRNLSQSLSTDLY